MGGLGIQRNGNEQPNRPTICGLDVHAGHGPTYDNIGAIASTPEITELNIGHFLVGEALFVSLAASIIPHAPPDERSAKVNKHLAKGLFNLKLKAFHLRSQLT